MKPTLLLRFDAATFDATNTRILDLSGLGNHCVYSGTITKLSKRGITFGASAKLTLPALPTTYTVSIFKRVNNLVSISWENVNTTYNLIGTAGGFSGDLLGLVLHPETLTQIQKYDEQIRMMKSIQAI